MYNFEIKWVSPLGSQNGKISFRTPSGRWDRDGEHNVLLGVTPLIWDLHVWRSWREKPTTTSSYSNFPAEYRSHDLFIIFERMVDYSTRRPSSAATADYGGAANGADLMDGSCTQNLTRLSLNTREEKDAKRSPASPTCRVAIKSPTVLASHYPDHSYIPHDDPLCHFQ